MNSDSRNPPGIITSRYESTTRSQWRASWSKSANQNFIPSSSRAVLGMGTMRRWSRNFGNDIFNVLVSKSPANCFDESEFILNGVGFDCTSA
ncbi:hypothetical protein CDAR_556441 [Caerostris darwini]|uniref:Uncharacterized protein n=1 Tax=Caerostris darwini TaxID=1538125 RepID=A0AAV4SU70_9ARAC|nr:hypothetical protein CDAR_556441 [Caerostris darwini]